MAVTRTISTRLVMENEKSYRDAIKAINQEYRTLDSALKLVDSTYKGQQNTLAALEAKNKALNDIIQKQTEKLNEEKNALSQMKGLQAEYANAAESARAKLQALTGGTDEAAKEAKEYQEELKALQAEVAKFEAKERDAAGSVAYHTTQMNKAQIGLNDLNGKLTLNEKYLDEAKNSTDGCAKSIDEYGKEVKEAAEDTKDFGAKGKEGVDALAAALAAAGIAATVKQIADALLDAVKASIEFESAFAGVKKTVNASEAEYERLSDSIKEMSTRIPATTTELAGIMEMAGQLGVRGSENLIKFTETIAALGESTNLSSESAATMLAQFANITGMDISNIERLGSVIVDLGNNFATNEQKIVDMAQRLASAFTQLGMSEAEIVAFATALSSMGIEADAGGTAFTKLGTQMKVAAETGTRGLEIIAKTGKGLRDLTMFADEDGAAFKELAHDMGLTGAELKEFMSAADDLNKFADVAGMTAEQFAKAFGEDAAGAIMEFLKGLKQIEDSGGSMITTLEEMGIKEVRLGNAVRSTANGYEVVEAAQSRANEAWEKNIALQNEAAERYKTTESKITLFKNSVNNLKIAIGDELTPAIRTWVDTGTGVMQWAEALVKQNPAIVHLVTALTAAGAAFVGVAGAIVVVSKAWAALSGLMAANPWVLAAAAVAAVGAALISFVASTREADEELEALKETAENIGKNIKDAKVKFEVDVKGIESAVSLADQYIAKLEGLETQILQTGEGQEEYEAIVARLRTLIPELNLAIDEQTGVLEGGADAIRGQVTAWEALARTQAGQELHTQLLNAHVEAEWEYQKALAEQVIRTEEVQKWEGIRNATLEEMAGLLGMNAEEIKKLSAADISDFQNMVPDEMLGRFAELLKWLFDVEGSLDKSTQEAEGYKEELEKLGGVAKDAGADVELFGKTTGKAADETGDAAGETEEYAKALAAIQEKAKAVQTEIEKLNQSYEDSYNAALKNIEGSVGLFERMERASAQSVNGMILSLKSQETYFNEYAANLKKAAELGLDEGILRELANFSPENANMLAGIARSTADGITQINDAYKNTEGAKTALAETTAGIQSDFETTSETIKQEYKDFLDSLDQEDAAQVATASTLQGAINGLNSQMPQFRALVDELTALMASATSASAQISSVQPAGSHMAGLEYVPYDSYLAELHKGEMVLTALEAKAYRAEEYANYGMQSKFSEMLKNSPMYGGTTVVVQDSARDTGRNSTRGGVVIENLIINSPEPLSEYEIGKQIRSQLENIAFSVG